MRGFKIAVIDLLARWMFGPGYRVETTWIPGGYRIEVKAPQRRGGRS